LIPHSLALTKLNWPNYFLDRKLGENSGILKPKEFSPNFKCLDNGLSQTQHGDHFKVLALRWETNG
jgi:hypothetical protein